jgi:hypothetical protein
MIRARVNYDNTLLYGLRNFLYKGVPVHIEYETESGKIIQYDISKQCAMAGLFVNPLWTDNQLHFMNIKRVRFLNDRARYFTNHLTVVFESEAIIKPGLLNK